MRSTDPHYSNGTGTKENIRAIEQDIDRHQKDLTELYAKYETLGRTNWQIILSSVGIFVALVAALWALAVQPLNADLVKLDHRLTTIEVAVAQRGILFENNRVKVDGVAAETSRFRDRFLRIERDFMTTRDFSAASGVYMTRHTELQNQLVNLGKKVDEVFPPQKTLEDLTRRLAELERTRVLPYNGQRPPPNPFHPQGYSLGSISG